MRTRQKGFSLVEALIALVVLSFGLIGMAGMQTRALLDAQQSYLDSVATLAAVDAQERLWIKLADQIRDNGPEDCKNIAEEVSTNSDYLDTPWQESWFSGSESPLKNKTGNIVVEEDDCEFTITINASSNPLDFFVRLPKL